MDECVSMSTSIATGRLDVNLQGTPTDQTTYRRMIRGLMYLTASRPDITFATFVCARYQARPTARHLKEVKRIFRYLRQSYNMGLWYPKDSKFELIAYSDAEHAGCKDDCKSTSGGLQFLGEKLVSWSSKNQDCTAISTTKAEYVSLSACYIIMAQPQRQADVHQDELCPPNKRYALMDANKKIDINNPLCSNESKILANILQNHPLRFSIAASSSVPWIYLGQFWHTLKEDVSKYRLNFVLDRKELTMTLDDFRTIFQLPQATNNNHECFVDAPKFLEMVPFYINDLGFTLELRSPSNFKTIGLVQQLRIPPRRSTRLTPPTPIPTTTKADDIILQDTIQLSLAEQKSDDELEAKKNIQKVEEHLIAEEIEKLVEGTENVENAEVDSSTLRQNDNQNDPGTRLEPRSNKECPKVEITVKVQPVNTIEEEDESAEDDYELKEGKKGRRFMPRKKFHVLAQHLQEVMEESLPKMADARVQELTKTQVPIYVSHGLIMERQKNQADVTKMIADAIQQERENLRAEITSQINNAITNHIPSQVDSSVRNYISGHILHVHPTQASQASAQEQQYQLYLTMKDNPQQQHDDLLIWLDDPHDDAHPEGDNSANRQKTSEHGAYVFGELSSGQVNESKPGPSTLGNQEQLDDFDFWTDSYATDDDELPTEKVSQELMEEMLQTVDEAKLRKVVNEMLRQRCTSRDEHQYHIDQMQNLLKNDIVDKCVKKFNPYARYSVEHWKNPHAKIFYIKKQKEPGKSKEVVYSNSKIVQIIKTYWELGHEHKFIIEIIAKRANGSIVSINESDYKNLNKNDIEDLYLLIVNGKVDDYAETGLLWSLTVFIRSIHKMFSIVSEPVYGIIYKNNKKEKRVMRHQEVHNFCDATLKRVLEGLKSYNNNVKHGYVTLSLSKEDAEYLQLFEEDIKEQLNHYGQMRRWEMYVNGRPLESRRERPE
ncbi:hypothetical protein Tco_0270102 [Tanacetum coccineum]